LARWWGAGMSQRHSRRSTNKDLCNCPNIETKLSAWAVLQWMWCTLLLLSGWWLHCWQILQMHRKQVCDQPLQQEEADVRAVAVPNVIHLLNCKCSAKRVSCWKATNLLSPCVCNLTLHGPNLLLDFWLVWFACFVGIEFAEPVEVPRPAGTPTTQSRRPNSSWRKRTESWFAATPRSRRRRILQRPAKPMRCQRLVCVFACVWGGTCVANFEFDFLCLLISFYLPMQSVPDAQKGSKGKAAAKMKTAPKQASLNNMWGVWLKLHVRFIFWD